jgi:hypothetical protein
MTIYDKIVEYGKEYGIDCLSVEGLINSHRDLFKMCIQQESEFKRRLKYIRENAKKEILDSQYIKIEDLRMMTVEELCKLAREITC